MYVINLMSSMVISFIFCIYVISRDDGRNCQPKHVAYTYLFTHSMQHSPSWEAKRFLASQEIPRILRNPKVHYRIHKCPQPPLSWVRSYQNISPGPRFLCEQFVTRYFLRWWVFSTLPKPQIKGPPIVCCPRLLIQYIRSYPAYWRPFLHVQTEDGPCRGDMDPLIT